MYQQSVSIDDVIDGLADFIQPFVGEDVKIIRGQVNRTSPPPESYVELTEVLSVDLAVPYQGYGMSDQPEPQFDLADLKSRSRFDVQIDFYGPSSGEWCRMVQTAFRTIYGFDNFPENIKPLYTSDGLQHPWNTAEQQSVTRWTLTASIQYNPSVSVPQQFADELVATVEVPVDTLPP